MKRKKDIRKKGMRLVACLLALSMIFSFTVVSEAASTVSAEEQFRQLYLHLLETGDSSVQDISDLNLKYSTCYDIAQDVKENEGLVPYFSHEKYPIMENMKMEGKGLESRLVKFSITKDDGFVERYNKVKEIIASQLNQFDDKMTDLDKIEEI